MKEPKWILPEVIIDLHDTQIAEFGGLSGVRDENLLLSAITRPQNLYHYGSPTIFEMAASLAFGLAKNHPFNDANKRTSYVSTRLFLRLNGCDLSAKPAEKLAMMVSLAEGEISEKEFAIWLEKNSVVRKAKKKKKQ